MIDSKISGADEPSALMNNIKHKNGVGIVVVVVVSCHKGIKVKG